MSTTQFRKERLGSVTCCGTGRKGGKGHNIWNMNSYLQGQNLARIPNTWILTQEIIDTIDGDTTKISEFLRTLKLPPGIIAVRSSALSEDGKMNCPGVFDTLFAPSDQDQALVALAIKRVVDSCNCRRANSYLSRNGLEHGMAVVLQSAIGTNVSKQYLTPVFGGVLDTSSVNGDGTMTLSVAIGLGTVAVGGVRNSNLIILKRGSFSERNTRRIPNQKFGEVIDRETGATSQVDLEQLLRLLKLPSRDEAIKMFLHRYTVPLHLLALALETHFDGSPVDVEFAVSAATGGKRLYLLQARISKMKKVVNEDYPTTVPTNKVLSVSRTVLGAKTVKTTKIAAISSKDYLTDAESGFPALIELDRRGEPYILIIPPEATSSQKITIPLPELHNLVFLIEELTNEQVHDIGATGIDHISRITHELDLGYMEGFINFDRLRRNSNVDMSIRGIELFEGKFGAAVCSATSKGVFYIE